MIIRLPSAECYASKVKIEQKWLPFLSKYLSVQISEPIAMGKPSKNYPYNWSVYKWIEGESANVLQEDKLNLNSIAEQLAQFLNELQKIDITGAPVAGVHNFYRGASPIVYNVETKDTIVKLKELVDVEIVTEIWLKAISSKWQNKPVWIHGDLSSGNILIKDKKLVAIIDFGGMAIGDPACDLTIAWTLFEKESRDIFRSSIKLDSDTWARARGWALWKALITLASLKDKNDPEFIKQQQIINEIINEHKLEYNK